VKEHAVEQEDRGGERALLGRIHSGVGIDIEDGPPEPA
jgi:hypothetical protein